MVDTFQDPTYLSHGHKSGQKLEGHSEQGNFGGLMGSGHLLYVTMSPVPVVEVVAILQPVGIETMIFLIERTSRV